LSSGDKSDPFPFTIAEANTIIRFPPVARNMQRNPKINSRDYDIPYVSGYSVDGGTIYIDRDLPLWIYLGKEILPNRFLILHEHVEKSVIDAVENSDDKDRQRLLILLNMVAVGDNLYEHANCVATACELYAVQLQHDKSGAKAYSAFMSAQVKRAASTIRRVPADLDMTPYQGDHRRDLRAAMDAAMGRHR
jgi:hypothetical protein